MDDSTRIALLIDADNTQLSKVGLVIDEIAAHGRIVVRRAYGNWRKDTLKKWEGEVKRLAIRAVQQFDYVSGKNATDMALVIDAMDLLANGDYDAFVIMASDSDYTPLAIRLQESGVQVFGAGERKTPEAFRNACDEFIYLENLGAKSEKKPKQDENDKKRQNDEYSRLHQLLKDGLNKYADDAGYADMADVGNFVKRAWPDFDTRSFGCQKLSELLETFPKKYEIKRVKLSNGGSRALFKKL